MLNDFSPIILLSEKIYTLYVPPGKYSSTSQYTVTFCSSPVYSIYFFKRNDYLIYYK